ncbi:hypothetical protein [Archaeoglobus neptunius]|uniref:hypothetical protein n=1 Tax=Archaeoglobus neptunius TaxID=2798580 RepID=UPI0019270B01|nr:hypothetical protein [Archaeoglobus neptunius]
MKMPKNLDEIKNHFGDLIDEVTAKLLENYAKGEENETHAGKYGRVTVRGRVVKVFPIRHFSKNGRDGKVCSVIIEDDCRINFWNDAAELIEAGDVVEGVILRVRGWFRNGEVQVNSISEVEIETDFVEISQLEKYRGRRVNLRGWVSGIGDPEKAEEIFISDKTGRVRVALEDKEVYFKADIGSYIEVFNGIVTNGGVYVDKNSRVRFGE